MLCWVTSWKKLRASITSLMYLCPTERSWWPVYLINVLGGAVPLVVRASNKTPQLYAWGTVDEAETTGREEFVEPVSCLLTTVHSLDGLSPHSTHQQDNSVNSCRHLRGCVNSRVTPTGVIQPCVQWQLQSVVIYNVISIQHPPSTDRLTVTARFSFKFSTLYRTWCLIQITYFCVNMNG